VGVTTEGETSPHDRRIHRASTLVLAALVLGLVGIASWWIGFRPVPGDDALAALDRAHGAGRSRSVEGRLVGLAAYRAFDPAIDRPTWARSASTSLRLAAARLASPGADASGVRDRGNVAIAALASGDVDRAVRVLEDQAAATPGDARVKSDLAAAYLARARDEAQSGDIAKALEAAEQALMLAPGSPEATFNRALALDSLHVTDAAAAAWRNYLAADAASPWAAEARARLASLEAIRAAPPAGASPSVDSVLEAGDAAAVRATMEADPTAVRAAIGERLDAWATGCLERDRCGPVDQGERLARNAQILTDVTSDRLDADWSSAIDAAPDAARRGLAVAYQATRRGRSLYEAFRFEEAGLRFAEARAALATIRDAIAPQLAAEPILEQGAVHYQSQAFAAAAPLLREARSIAQQRGYRRVAARAALLLGHIDVNTGRVSEGLDWYRRSTADFEAARDLDGLVNARISAAQT
jgi:tetratricopeptide (TPR) repeat protein